MSKPTTFAIDQETAEAELERWAEAMDLYFEDGNLSDEDRQALHKQKSKLIRALRLGTLVITDEGEARYAPQNKKSSHQEPIVFHERTGGSLMAIDGKAKNQDVKKMYAMMAELTGLPPKTFAGLVGIDIKTCEAIFVLLMD